MFDAFKESTTRKLLAKGKSHRFLRLHLFHLKACSLSFYLISWLPLLFNYYAIVITKLSVNYFHILIKIVQLHTNNFEYEACGYHLNLLWSLSDQ